MTFHLEGRVVFFATNNIHKFNEARIVLKEYNIAVGMLRVKSLEIQSDNLQEISEASVNDAFEKCQLPVVVEDAGLFVTFLNGFPGPYAAYVYKTIGNRGLLNLLRGCPERSAMFRSVIAYKSPTLNKPIDFVGAVSGHITKEEKHSAKNGFGFDPIFRPLNNMKTFAEMNSAEKNRYSHRASAFRKFARWYKKLGEHERTGH